MMDSIRQAVSVTASLAVFGWGAARNLYLSVPRSLRMAVSSTIFITVGTTIAHWLLP